jgi:xylulokinase
VLTPHPDTARPATTDPDRIPPIDGIDMAVRHILTIDLGTSGPKAAIVSSEGALVGSARASVATSFGPGSAEQDAEDIWRATVEAALGALKIADVDRTGIAAVVPSAQYSSIVPVGVDGTPVAPMILWMDQRGAPKRLKVLAGYPKHGDSPHALATYLRVHGLAPVTPGMSITHMRRLRFAEPAVYDRTASFLEPVDYLTARLTGRRTANQCSSFMQLLSDNRTVPSRGWHPALVAASMIDAGKLPEPVPVGSVVGTLLPDVADALGLAASTPVLSGINDTQAGAIAAGAYSGTHAGLALGTTAVMVTHVAKKKVNPLRSLYTMPSPLGGNHLLSAENGVAGVAVDHFIDKLVYPEDPFTTADATETGDAADPAHAAVDRYQAFNEAAAGAPPGASGVLFLPWLRGSIAPHADGRMRGGFVNVGLDSTRSDLARAVFEGVALNLRWLQGPVETFIRREITHYVFYGGGARSDVWAQVMADVLGKPIHQMEDAGFANSLGAAVFGFDSLGVVAARELSPRLGIRTISRPDPANRGRYDELAVIFGDAFRRTRPLVHRLARLN